VCAGRPRTWKKLQSLEAKRGKEYEGFDCRDYEILNREDLSLFVSKKKNQPKDTILY